MSETTPRISAPVPQERAARKGGGRSRDRGLLGGAWLIALICVAPVVSVAVTAMLGSLDTFSKMADSVLGGYALTTLWLALIVSIGVAVIGTATAWLVTNCRFPGRGFLEVALALPLAFPAYVLAYAYTDLLDHPGPVQSVLRELMGWGPHDYWFPEIRSLGGAAAMLILVLYPYVYLLARSAFLQQSVCASHVARTLGCGPWGTALRVSLPMARPAIAGGVMLALMETIADFGTVAHFGVQTFSTGIYKAWFSSGDRLAAGQLSLCLLGFAALLLLLERMQRGIAQRHQAGLRYEALPEHRLRGWRAALAAGTCLLPVLFGFLVPLVVLGLMAMESANLSARYGEWAWNSVSLAGISALVITAAAALIAYAARIAPGRASRLARWAAGLGYAIPGGVIAVGLMVPLAHADRELTLWLRATFDWNVGLLITGSMVILILAYMSRFIAVALSSVEAGLSTIRPSVDQASRVLGCSGGGAFRRVHIPMLRGSLLTAALIVFVDVMKELPATMILRPFNFDTLAVQAFRYASDERLPEAALPSIAIVAFGLLPVILLSRQIRRSRPGHNGG